MTSDAIGKLLLIIFFLLCSAYFSATETAFSSLSRSVSGNMDLCQVESSAGPDPGGAG